MKTYAKKGEWNVICDRCGFKKKISDVALTWDNLLVCKNTCWEPRQPQDFVQGVRDKQTVPITRTEPEDTFVS